VSQVVSQVVSQAVTQAVSQAVSQAGLNITGLAINEQTVVERPMG